MHTWLTGATTTTWTSVRPRSWWWISGGGLVSTPPPYIHTYIHTYIYKSLENTVHYVYIMEMCVLHIVYNCLLYIVQMCILCKVCILYIFHILYCHGTVLYLSISPSVHLCTWCVTIKRFDLISIYTCTYIHIIQFPLSLLFYEMKEPKQWFTMGADLLLCWKAGCYFSVHISTFIYWINVIQTE